RGERLDFQREQPALKGLLRSDAEARRWGEYAGDPNQSISGRRDSTFLGIRYALTCWLDEVFIFDSPWREEWKENALEIALYGTPQRAAKFWGQARKGEARPETDAVEVYFLCVVRGFRGESRNAPDNLRAWRDGAGAQIAQNQGAQPPLPPES